MIEPQAVSNSQPSGDDGTDAEPAQPSKTAAAQSSTDVTEASDQSPVRAFFDWAIVIVAALLIAILLRTFFLAHFRVEGSSMLETLHPGDRVFVNKLSYRFSEPSRGDVVVLHELQGERDLIKRVIALPGETVRIEGCVVYIDDAVLPEPYLSDEVRSNTEWCEMAPVVVPTKSVFVMGDNRPASADSRYFGPIPEEDVVGRAFVIFWPTSDARWL